MLCLVLHFHSWVTFSNLTKRTGFSLHQIKRGTSKSIIAEVDKGEAEVTKHLLHETVLSSETSLLCTWNTRQRQSDLLLDFIDLLIQHRSHLKAPWKWNKNGNMDPWADELSILNISRKSNSCTERQHRAMGHDKNTWEKLDYGLLYDEE